MTVLEDLQDLRAKQEDRELRRARQEADLDVLKSRIKAAMKVLATDYNVDSLPAAKSLLATMEAELAAKIVQLQEALKEPE